MFVSGSRSTTILLKETLHSFVVEPYCGSTDSKIAVLVIDVNNRDHIVRNSEHGSKIGDYASRTHFAADHL